MTDTPQTDAPTLQERLREGKRQAYTHKGERIPFAAYDDDYIGYRASDPLRIEAADHIDAQAAKIKALVEAVAWLDAEIKEHGFPAEGPMRSHCRATLAAAKETT